MTDKTLLLIKPNATIKHATGNVLKMIVDANFVILALKSLCMTKELARRFYDIHKEKPFFNDLVDFMTSGVIVAVIIQKENAVEELRSFVGATNPAEAEEGTIRKIYGDSLTKNAVHASDSNENAVKEINVVFTELELKQHDLVIG